MRGVQCVICQIKAGNLGSNYVYGSLKNVGFLLLEIKKEKVFLSVSGINSWNLHSMLYVKLKPGIWTII
jgi:hypothetical protein